MRMTTEVRGTGDVTRLQYPEQVGAPARWRCSSAAHRDFPLVPCRFKSRILLRKKTGLIPRMTPNGCEVFVHADGTNTHDETVANFHESGHDAADNAHDLKAYWPISFALVVNPSIPMPAHAKDPTTMSKQ